MDESRRHDSARGPRRENAAVSAVERHLRQQAHDGGSIGTRTDDLVERAKSPRVEDDAIVPIVTTQHLAQPAMLLPNRGMHPPPHLLSDLLELAHHAFDLCFALDHELAAPGLPAVVRKARAAFLFPRCPAPPADY